MESRIKTKNDVDSLHGNVYIQGAQRLILRQTLLLRPVSSTQPKPMVLIQIPIKFYIYTHVRLLSTLTRTPSQQFYCRF
jgi:hypothetical protein